MKKQRIVIIDSLRGFALAGVALVHVVEQYVAGPTAEGVLATANQGIIDGIVQGIISLFFTSKFFALFSVLFGLSFYIMMKSAEERDESFTGRFLWRSVILLGFGLLHQIFYRGDILFIYATLVPFLLPFYKVKTKWVIVAAAICFFSLFKFLSFLIWVDQPIFGSIPMMDLKHPSVQAYTDLLQNGTFWAIAQENLTNGMAMKMNFQMSVFGRYYYTLGYFLIGMLLGRIGLFENIEAFVQYRKRAIWYAVGLMVAGVALGITFFIQGGQQPDWTTWWPVLGMNFMDWMNIALATLILIGFISWYRTSRGEKLLSAFAPYGRMALTNYVLQSVIGTFLLFNWGLGLFASLRIYQLFLIGIVIIALQMVFSKYWLQYFKYGPLEWLWRSLTYLKVQPFLK